MHFYLNRTHFPALLVCSLLCCDPQSGTETGNGLTVRFPDDGGGSAPLFDSSGAEYELQQFRASIAAISLALPDSVTCVDVDLVGGLSCLDGAMSDRIVFPGTYSYRFQDERIEPLSPDALPNLSEVRLPSLAYSNAQFDLDPSATAPDEPLRENVRMQLATTLDAADSHPPGDYLVVLELRLMTNIVFENPREAVAGGKTPLVLELDPTDWLADFDLRACVNGVTETPETSRFVLTEASCAGLESSLEARISSGTLVAGE